MYASELGSAIAKWSGDPAAPLKALREAIAAPPSRDPTEPLPKIPDLVASVGEAKARQVLVELLTTSKGPFMGVDGLRTRELARKIAIDNVTKLKVAQWYLVSDSSATSITLYEALAKRFPKAEGQGQEADMAHRREATAVYVRYLLRKGRVDQAAKLSAGGALGTVTSSGHFEEEIADLPAETIFRFWQLLVGSGGAQAPWTSYATAALAANKADIAEAAMRKRLAEENAPESPTLVWALYDLLVAQEKFDAALKVADREKSLKATRLLQLGRVLQRKELVDEAVRFLLATPDSSEKYMSYEPGAGTGIGDLIALGRFADAEQVAAQSLTTMLQQMPGGMGGFRGSNGHLATLAAIYSAAGRPQDIVTLLESAPYWGAADLANLLEVPSPGGAPLGYLAAKALFDVGRRAEAERVLIATLNASRNYDPAYELLLNLKGDQALEMLDAMYLQDQFEERPLIFKAVQLLKMKRTGEAEQAIRKAISIDPSDGEQLYGTRMRAYSVLADVLEAKGDHENAKVFRGAVSAIRLSEQADEMHAAGLTKRAVDLYKRSLQLFADAYCIQSRLAIQLAQLGRHEEAEEHYRRAYELMPDSFGRVESHCFGCEGAFASDQAQGIAESVFLDLMKKTPDKPQVRYLLGYLRDIQSRPVEALAYFKQAVKLDPDYLNAWKEINEMSDLLTPAERQDVAFQLLRLDPLQNHGGADFGNVSDMKALWVELEKALKKLPPPRPSTLMALPASAMQFKSLVEQRPELAEYAEGTPASYGNVWSSGIYEIGGRAVSPAQPLAMFTILLHISSVMDTARQLEMYGR